MSHESGDHVEHVAATPPVALPWQDSSGVGQGRERIYFEHFWNDFAADKTRSVPEKDRRIYAAAYARAHGMRAGFEYFKSFEQDARDFGG